MKGLEQTQLANQDMINFPSFGLFCCNAKGWVSRRSFLGSGDMFLALQLARARCRTFFTTICLRVPVESANLTRFISIAHSSIPRCTMTRKGSKTKRAKSLRSFSLAILKMQMYEALCAR